MIISLRMKRFLFAVNLLGASVVGTALFVAYLVSREPPFNWDQANIVEARLAKSKLKLYDDALKTGEKGYVRLSQGELNSYLHFFSTHKTNVTEAPLADRNPHLRQVGVSLSRTNLTLYSWAEMRLVGVPVRFVMQRDFNVRLAQKEGWDLEPSMVRVGDLEIPARYWPQLRTIMEALDQPLRERFAWATNIQASIVTKNELSQRPELRLYNYNPFFGTEIR